MARIHAPSAREPVSPQPLMARRPWLACLLVVLTAADFTQAFTQASAQAVRVTGTGVQLVPPDGFEPATLYPGFQDPASGATLMVTEMPAPFAEARQGMTKARLATRGMTARSIETIDFADVEGLLISVDQQATGMAWLGLFGDAERTVMVVAAFPRDALAELGESLERSVRSARYAEAPADPFEGLIFRIPASDELKLANRMGNMVTLTKDGQRGIVAPRDPLCLVGSSYREVDIDDLEAFARERLLQTAEVQDIDDIEGESARIDGRPAYVLTADARDLKSGTALRLFQAVAVDGDVYVLVQGMVGKDAAKRYLPAFRKIADGLTFQD